MASIDPRALEQTTRKIGEEIFARAEAATPSVFSMEYWQQYAMGWMTQDEDLKLRLFRFIEVLPALRSNEAIASHLLEYLKRTENGHPPLPLPLRMAVAFKNPESFYASMVARAARWGCSIMAGQFNAGSTPTEAIATVLGFRRQGMAFTLDVLGETIIADRIAREHQEMYIRLIREIGQQAKSWAPAPLLDEASWGPIPRVNISLKLSANRDEIRSGRPGGHDQGRA